jgi:hypothetical protein
MMIWQGISLLSAIGISIFLFLLLYSVFAWLRIIHITNKEDRWQQILTSLHLHKILNISPKTIALPKLTSFLTFKTLLLILGIIYVSYSLYFDLLKLIAILLIHQYPLLVLPSFALAMFIIDLLIPFVIVGINTMIELGEYLYQSCGYVALRWYLVFCLILAGILQKSHQ